jgi:lysozyme
MNALQKQQALAIAASAIAGFEGGMAPDGKFHVYFDVHGKVWTQGFGHTDGVTPRSRPWTLRKAKRVLRRDLRTVYSPPLDALGLPGPHYYAAILSAVYNLGVGLLEPTHDLGRQLHAHHWFRAVDSLDEYVKSGGKVLPGLVVRRNAEQALAELDLPKRKHPRPTTTRGS